MKRFYFILTSALLILTATAFTSIQQQKNTTVDASVDKIMEVISLWDASYKSYQPNKGRDATWLKVGFRAKYAMVKKYASLKMVESAFGMPVFLKGPHQGDMDFNNNTSFGYYNPEFIAQLEANMEEALSNPSFKKMAQKVYQQYLKGMIKTYHDAYIYIKPQNTEFQQEYMATMKTGGGSLQETFRTYANGQDANWYEAVTAPSFWVRRSIDGTGEQLFGLLNKVIIAFEGIQNEKSVLNPFPKSGTSLEDLVPTGWVVLKTAKGDLNKDHLEDLAIIIQDTKQGKITYSHGNFVSTNLNPRVLAIYFKNAKGIYVLNRQVNHIIRRQDVEGLEEPLDKLDITKRGILKIYTHTWMSAGSYWTSNMVYSFRFQNQAFALIGFDLKEYSRSSGKTTTYSMNFSTRKMRKQNYNEVYKNVPFVETWTQFKLAKLQSMQSLSKLKSWEVEGVYVHYK